MLKKSLILIIFMFQIQCSEDFLDIDQKGSTAQEEFYKTDEEALESLMAVYDNLQARNFWLYNLLNALSDEAYAGGGQRGDNGGILEEINEFRFGATNISVRETFAWNYSGIYRANKIIDNVEPNSTFKKIIIGQAFFLRAFHYFYLVTLWGDVPLVLHELPENGFAKPRISASEIWDQIESDLGKAISNLPERSEMPELLKNLAAKGTATALLGKALLFQEKFDDAAYFFDKVIQSNEYDLYTDYAGILRPETENGVESLFEVAFTTSKKYIQYPGVESNFWLWYLSPRETYFEGGYLKIFPGWGFFNPKKSLYDAFIAAEDSVRLKSTLISESNLALAGGKLRNVYGYLPYANDGYARIKYVLYMADGGLPDPKANNGTNIRLFRFADVLLMAAEAHNRKLSPDDEQALTYLNRVRERVRMEPVDFNGTELFDAIKNERRLELAFEFVRFQDLIRWGDAAEVLKDQGKLIPLGNGEFLSFPEAGFKTGRNELLPIPELEMNVNPFMYQNPGY